jgi:hypothetical protein
MRIDSCVDWVLLKWLWFIGYCLVLLRIQKIILLAYILVAQFFDHFVPIFIVSDDPFLFLAFSSWLRLAFIVIGISTLILLVLFDFISFFAIFWLVDLLPMMRCSWLSLSTIFGIDQLANDVLSGSIVSRRNVLLILGLFVFFLYLNVHKGL